MDASQGLTFKKVLIMGIGAGLICTVIVAGGFVYLNKKTAEGIHKNVILDDINSSSTPDDLGPREGGTFTRMGIINPPYIEEPVKVVATTTPQIATTTVVATTTPVVKPKPKPKPVVIEENTDEVNADDPTVDDTEVSTDDAVIEDNNVDVQDNPGT
jgi:hypothetical protein